MTDTMQDYLKKLQFVTPETGVLDIYNLMKSKKIRHLPVIDKGESVGIISDRDVQFVHATKDTFQLKAKDIMTSEPYSVDIMTTVAHVVNIMAQKKISSVLIHDKSKKVVGIFTSTDALNILTEHYKSSDQFIEDSIKESVIH